MPRWAYGAAGAGLLFLVLVTIRILGGLEAERRRRRARRLVGGTVAVLLVGAAAGGAYHYSQDR
ncbi:MAG: hypothetical protein HYV94_12970, partial [Candidatus Rokubacteria bacterium]|nr:hypothetical protein [Candidatus Rokubacteria bacterium]